MGAPESVAEAFEKVWEGHLRQFSRARIPTVELAKDGIFVKEFPPSFDWEHTGEGLQAFYWYGLGRPNNQASLARARRFAGFYLNEDPAHPTTIRKLKIIKSLFNGSIGPITRPVTPVDWDGDENPKRAARFSTSSNIRGDHPLNLLATTLATQAYLLTHDPKYKRWVLEYVDAWRDRAAANGGNFPSNIGLDGKIGGEWGGKWYGGIFGWNSPDDGLRNYVLRGIPAAFGQAAMLSREHGIHRLRFGGRSTTSSPRRERRTVRCCFRTTTERRTARSAGTDTGRGVFPDRRAGKSFRDHHRVVSLVAESRRRDSESFRIRPTGVRCRDGSSSFRDAGRIIRSKRCRTNARIAARSAERIRIRTTTDTARAPSRSNRSPTSRSGAANLYGSGDVLRSQVRYFDPERRRAGLAEDVAALVEKIEPDSITLTLVNTSTLGARRLIVQMGVYGEHQAISVRLGDQVDPGQCAALRNPACRRRR